MSVDVKRILKDLGEFPLFRFPEHIKRSGHVARDGWGVDCSEVYSPPRVTKLAGEVGLQAGCALDLTTLDDEGNPWPANSAGQGHEVARRGKAVDADHMPNVRAIRQSELLELPAVR